MDSQASRQPGKTFRFGAQRALLTYKSHLTKVDYIEWLAEKTNIAAEFIRLAHENGDSECDYEHTHVVVDFGGRFQTTNERYFDYLDIHPHIKVLKNKRALEDAKVYISKEDPENTDLVRKESIVRGIMSCSNNMEALEKYCNKPGDALGIIAIHNLKPLDYRTSKPNWESFTPDHGKRS